MNSSFAFCLHPFIVDLRIKNIRRPATFDDGDDVVNQDSRDPLARVKRGAAEVRR